MAKFRVAEGRQVHHGTGTGDKFQSRVYAAGDTIELEAEEAEQLVNEGVIVPAGRRAANEEDEPAGPTAEEAEGEDDGTTDATGRAPTVLVDEEDLGLTSTRSHLGDQIPPPAPDLQITEGTRIAEVTEEGKAITDEGDTLKAPKTRR